MAEIQKQNENIEEKLYKSTVEEAVDEISRLPKGDVERTEAIIEEFLKDVDEHTSMALKFRGEVLRRVADRQKQAQDEREQRILEKFEGQVIRRSDGLRFAGVDKDAKFYVRAGSLFRRIFGKRYNAQDVQQLLEDIQDVEDEIERNQNQLDMLRAAKDSASRLKHNAGLIFKSKRKGKFLTGYFSDKYASYKAAWKLRTQAVDQYKEEGKEKLEAIEKREKELSRQREVLNKLRSQVEDRRKNGREIFEENFGPQVEVLQRMEGAELRREEEKLRQRVREFGKESGIVYLEYFLNEALGVSPQIASMRETTEEELSGPDAYREPLTRRDILKEQKVFNDWAQEWLDTRLSPAELQQTIAILRDEDPRLLQQILSTKRDEKTALRMFEVRFLFTGAWAKDEPILSKDRRAKLTPQKLARYFRYAADHGFKSVSKLKEALLIFANDKKWANYDAEDFDYVVDHIRKDMENAKDTEDSSQAKPASKPIPAAKKEPSPPVDTGKPPAAPIAEPTKKPDEEERIVEAVPTPDTEVTIDEKEELLLHPEDGVKYLYDALHLDDTTLAEQLYRDAFEDNPEWQEMLIKPNVRKMLAYFVEGKVIRDVETLPKTKEKLDDLMGILPVLNYVGLKKLRKLMKRYFKPDEEGELPTMEEFVRYLDQEYEQTVITKKT